MKLLDMNKEPSILKKKEVALASIYETLSRAISSKYKPKLVQY